MSHPFTTQQISDLEDQAIKMHNQLRDLKRSKGDTGTHFTTDERDRFGTLHVNLLCLVRELERRFGFQGK